MPSEMSPHSSETGRCQTRGTRVEGKENIVDGNVELGQPLRKTARRFLKTERSHKQTASYQVQQYRRNWRSRC